MYDYEARYLQLRSSGALGWAGDTQARNSARLALTIDALMQRDAFPKPPARALELGCGNGAASYHFARRGYDVFGIDISATATTWATDRFAEAGLAGQFEVGTVCDMRRLFGDGQLDLVFDGACLHCLMGRDRALCLDEVRRILRPAGTFIVSSMCGVPKRLDGSIRYDPVDGVLTENGQPYRTIRRLSDLVREIEQTGFSVDDHVVQENPWWDHVTMVCRRTTCSDLQEI